MRAVLFHPNAAIPNTLQEVDMRDGVNVCEV